MPFFLCTKEFFTIVRDHLTPGGVFVANTIGTETGAKSKFFRSVYKTMKAVLPQCHTFRVLECPSDLYNLEIFGVYANEYVPIETVRQRAAKATTLKDPRLAYHLTGYVKAVKYGDVPLLTDDYAPTDALLHLW